MHRKQVLQYAEQLARPRGIVPILLKLRYEVALSGNVFLAFGDVSFGLRQMFFPESALYQDRSSHTRCIAGLARFLILSHMRERPGR